MMGGQSRLNESLTETRNPNETTNSKIGKLLRPRKVIRDVIHEDIQITELERKIIDTKEFQRLHKIKQLGPVYLVYPNATHTRFSHSLGTLFMTQYLFEKAIDNPFKDERISINLELPRYKIQYGSPAPKFTIENYHLLLARTCALLHDLAHIPFGHTLSKEGHLFKDEWDDGPRFEYFLGNESPIGKILIETMNGLSISELSGELFLQDVQEILKVKDSDVHKLKYPFISDIIKNTICADLLDYLARDFYFCGLKETYDRRLLSYFYIGLYDGRPRVPDEEFHALDEKPRMILRLIKVGTNKFRRDVLSETLHLLRMRYSLAEKVYYHHAKISAAAMIISAVNSALIGKKIKMKDLYNIGDDELFNWLKRDEIGKYLVERIESRQLFKPVYKQIKISYDTANPVDEETNPIEKLGNNCGESKWRYQAERALERQSMIESGQVSIYCPSFGMGLKAVETLSSWGTKKITALKNIPERKQEIESSIINKHSQLWAMYVFVDQDLSEEKKKFVASDCKGLFELENRIENHGYRTAKAKSWETRFIEQAYRELSCNLPCSVMNEVLSSVHRNPSTGGEEFPVPDYKDYCTALQKEINSERK